MSGAVQLGFRHQPLLTCQRLRREDVYVHCSASKGRRVDIAGGDDYCMDLKGDDWASSWNSAQLGLRH